MLITDYLKANANEYGDKEAVVFIEKNTLGVTERTALTWYEFDYLSDQIAHVIKRRGVAKGDKVAIVLPNRLEWLPIYFAILKIGAVAVPINCYNSVDEIKYCLTLSDCSCAFFEYFENRSAAIERELQHSTVIWYLGEGIPKHKNDLMKNLSETVAVNSVAGVCEKNAASIYFSSGTTGKPKAVVLSHKALYYGAVSELSHHMQKSQDSFLCVAPFYHTGAMVHWLGTLAVGGRVVINNIRSPKKIAEIVENERISIAWFLVPHIQDILDLIDEGIITEKQFVSMKLMHTGAQPFPKVLILRWRGKFPNMSVDISYGLTEATGPGCIDLGIDSINKYGSIGRVDSMWKAIVVDSEGNEVKPGVVGELLLNGPGVMMGYYKDDVATEEALSDGWLRTGDMVYKDQDEYYYLVDRKKDVVIVGGENIYPVQLENFFRKFDFVKDVAVIGIPNPRTGESVVAIIELKNGYHSSKREIYELCADLPEYQRPLRVLFADVIRNTSGKIDKMAMRRLYFLSRKKK